jgi:RNA polymerase sigma-70 factor (ECF subfamily)
MERTSQSLLERLRRLDDEATWARFTALYAPLLYSWARRLAAQPADAADLVQDVLTVVVRQLPDFRYDPARSFRAWLRSILLNRWRTTCRRPPVLPLTADPVAQGPAGPDQLDEQEEAEYRRHLLRQTLEVLRPEFSPAFWKAFEQHVLAGRPADEVAAQLNIAPGTVYVAKSRVFTRLRQELTGLLDFGE